MSEKNQAPVVDVEALQAKLAEAEAAAAAAELEAAEAKAAAEKAAETAAAEKARADAAEKSAKAAPKAKAMKPETLKVVSATEYTYLIDGVRVTPDIPVSLERREGNLLDAQMKAGLIRVYE